MHMGSKQWAARNYSGILQNVGITSTSAKKKTTKQLERHFKGVANHYRIAILLLVSKEKGITLDEITVTVGGNFKTISEHTKKLVQAGLLEKKYMGRHVAHSVSPYGQKFIKFIQTF
jgi:predicted transcriptional regulator